MSVTLALYEPLNVKYMGNPFCELSASVLNNPATLDRFERENGKPDPDDPEYWKLYQIWFDSFFADRWSDGMTHDSITWCNWHDCRNQKNQIKKLEKFSPQIKKSSSMVEKIIPVRKVAYAQGWFFKNAFFKREVTRVYCTTWNQVEKFFCRYVKKGKMTVYRNFQDTWRDGMIFEASF